MENVRELSELAGEWRKHMPFLTLKRKRHTAVHDADRRYAQTETTTSRILVLCRLCMYGSQSVRAWGDAMLDRAGRVINLALSQRCSPRMGIKKLNPDTMECDATPSDFPDLDTETVKNSEPIPPPRIRQKLTEKEHANAAIKPPTPLSASTASHVSSLADLLQAFPSRTTTHRPMATPKSPVTIHGKMEAVQPHPPSRHHISNHHPGPSSHCVRSPSHAQQLKPRNPPLFFSLLSSVRDAVLRERHHKES